MHERHRAIDHDRIRGAGLRIESNPAERWILGEDRTRGDQRQCGGK
jgi:hypothetical protein